MNHIIIYWANIHAIMVQCHQNHYT